MEGVPRLVWGAVLSFKSVSHARGLAALRRGTKGVREQRWRKEGRACGSGGCSQESVRASVWASPGIQCSGKLPSELPAHGPPVASLHPRLSTVPACSAVFFQQTDLFHLLLGPCPVALSCPRDQRQPRPLSFARISAAPSGCLRVSRHKKGLPLPSTWFSLCLVLLR